MTMQREIERKFLVKQMPDLHWIKKVSYERYFLFCSENIEIRIQKKWEKFEFERKVTQNVVSAEKQKLEITQDEFLEMKKNAVGEIYRDSYRLSNNPNITLKVYHWDLEWFRRIEVEFDSVEIAHNFEAPEWFWTEITGKLGNRDSGICNITFEQLKKNL